MRLHRLALAAALAFTLDAARAADLLTIFRDAQVSDPVYQSSRAQYNATLEKLPQARSGYLPLVAGSASVFHNWGGRDIAPDLSYTTKGYAGTLSQPNFRLQNWISMDPAQAQVRH